MGKTSLQERRISSVFAKLITLPTFGKRTFSESYQVDSSSWEFLNRDVEDDCWNKTVNHDKHEDVDDKDKHEDVDDADKLEFTTHKHPSQDSLYESEYDSSCTM